MTISPAPGTRAPRRSRLPDPSSAEDAQQMQQILGRDIAQMEADLTDDGRRERMAGASYLAWQKRAKRALSHKRRELAEVNRWCREHLPQRARRSPEEAERRRGETHDRHHERIGQLAARAAADPALADDPVAILAGLRAVLLTLLTEEVELDDAERQILGLASDYLRRHPHPQLSWRP